MLQQDPQVPRVKTRKRCSCCNAPFKSLVREAPELRSSHKQASPPSVGSKPGVVCFDQRGGMTFLPLLRDSTACCLELYNSVRLTLKKLWRSVRLELQTTNGVSSHARHFPLEQYTLEQ